MKNIVVLGSTGFVGRSLLNKLRNEEYKLKIIIHKNDIKIKTKKFKGDILRHGILDDVIEKGDVVVNLIGQTSGKDSDLIDLNLIGGLNLLNTCVKRKTSQIILVSSINVYGENMNKPSRETDDLKPETNYGWIKLSTEKIYEYYSRIHGLNITILRMSHLYGPSKKTGIIANLISSTKNNNTVTVYNRGKQLRDFLFVDDASDGIIQTIKNPLGGFNIFNISSRKRYMVKDLIKIIEKITHKRLNVNLSSLSPDERCVWADNLKAKKIIKFSPQVNIEKGLKLTVEDFQRDNKIQ